MSFQDGPQSSEMYQEEITRIVRGIAEEYFNNGFEDESLDYIYEFICMWIKQTLYDHVCLSDFDATLRVLLYSPCKEAWYGRGIVLSVYEGVQMFASEAMKADLEAEADESLEDIWEQYKGEEEEE